MSQAQAHSQHKMGTGMNEKPAKTGQGRAVSHQSKGQPSPQACSRVKMEMEKPVETEQGQVVPRHHRGRPSLPTCSSNFVMEGTHTGTRVKLNRGEEVFLSPTFHRLAEWLAWLFCWLGFFGGVNRLARRLHGLVIWLAWLFLQTFCQSSCMSWWFGWLNFVVF